MIDSLESQDFDFKHKHRILHVKHLLLLLVCCNCLKIIVLAMKSIIVACFFHRYNLALLRLLLFNCNLCNYMLLLSFPFGLNWFSQCMLHVWLPAMFGAISLS